MATEDQLLAILRLTIEALGYDCELEDKDLKDIIHENFYEEGQSP